MNVVPKEQRKKSNAYLVMKQIQAIYREEGKLQELSPDEMSDGTLWEGQIALYFRWTCLPDCAVPELDADYRRNNRRLS